MELKSAVQEVVAIRKKTRAQFFGDIKVGDRLQFVMELNDPGRNGQVRYANYVTVTNLTQNTVDDSKSQTQVAQLLEHFELVEVGA